MRKTFLFCVLSVAVFHLFSQHNLSGSSKNSYYTYIYRIAASESLELYKSGMKKASEKYLRTLVDSFPVNENEPANLKEGNYLFVNARENELAYYLKTVGDVQLKLINNNQDLVIALDTKQGELIKDAKVSVNNRNIAFDANTNTYRINKRKKTGLICVYYQNTVHLFPLAQNNYGFYRHKRLLNQVVHFFPLKYITAALKKLFAKQNYYYNNFKNHTEYEHNFTGFMVFSKPKYKPGDTVKLKAYITSKSGKPVDRNLLLRLSGNDADKDTILTILQPYRAGNYEYQFVITDSLQLTLDDNELITLEELKSSKYDLNKYEGDLDDDEYTARRKVLMRGNFNYEEYELGKIRFTARADKETNHRGSPLAVYLKATDENDMAVPDGRVQLIVTTRLYGVQSFSAPSVFLPDTLWNYSQALEALGETKIIMPDSIFPAASFSYEIECVFLNADNEYKNVTLAEDFENKQHEIFFEQIKDSLQIEQKVNQRTEHIHGVLYSFDAKEDTLKKEFLQLPATIHINPFVKKYEMETDSADEEFELKYTKGMVSCVAARTSDSISIQGINPNHIPFWYTLFAGNKIIQRGYGDSLSYTGKVYTLKNYFVSLQYIYGNMVYSEDYTVPYQDKLLNVQVNQPVYIYPGQHVAVNISVTDKAGKPVSNADITAYSFTDKFEDARAPFVPYLGKIYPRRKRYLNFRQQASENKTGTSKLNWERWRREMGLDSIEYFKFLYPGSNYVNTEAVADSITQLAPFVVNKGDLQSVNQIYIDEVPYFFNQAAQLQRYSFKVSPGKHALRLRTYNKLIKLDSVWAFKGVKTFISINEDTAVNKYIRSEKMPDTLTNYEKGLWSKYMILVENNFGEVPATITQPNLLYLLNFNNNSSFNSSPYVLAGPLPDQYSTLFVKNKFSQNFESEGNYLFNISQGLIKQKQLPFRAYTFNKYLSSEPVVYNFHDLVLTQKELDSMWQNYLDHRSANEDLFRNENLNKFNNGRLQIGMGKDLNGKPVFIKNIFLFRYDDVDFVRAYKGTSVNLGYLQPGLYRILLLLKNDAYFIKDSIEIKKDGINYYSTGTIVPLPKNSMAENISATINSREKKWIPAFQENDLNIIKESFNDKYIDAARFPRYISGSVTDLKDGLPIVGASVIIKGTKFGTQTNKQGFFSMKAPEKGAIVIASIGYNMVEKRINDQSDYTIKLSASLQALSEVVVTGYGVAHKRDLTGSVSTVSTDNFLQGKVGGLQINLRGTATVDANNPLIIVDGIPYEGKLDSASIYSIKVLDAATAMALYGSKASAGVIIITTKKSIGNNEVGAGNAEMPASNALRRHFNDAAYWQPKLQTDIDGKVYFDVIFPDDITKWRTFVIATADKKQTGFTVGFIKSFKAISANLSLPVFAVEGDSINAIGKTLNYTMDSISLKRSITTNDKLVKETTIHLMNSVIDTFSVIAEEQDSLKVKYTVQKQDGYFDGEERTIPVFKQGVKETKGYFASLDNDTSFSMLFDANAGKIKIHAESSALPVLLNEIENIQQYEYLCNEQLASKLKAFLLKKKIYGYLKKEFKEEKNINTIIAKLNQGRSLAGLWGWWNNNEPSLWISLHATEALLLAEKDGYSISMNKEIIKDYLIYNFEKYNTADMISSVLLLKALNAKVDFKKYIDTLKQKTFVMSMYQRLQFLQLKQQLAIPVVFDTLVQKFKTTMFGNMYWGEENNYFFDNAVQNTLLMYRLMKTAGGYERQLQKIRNYFFEKRKRGYWNNTYESSLILETILPDILKNDTIQARPILVINNLPAVQSFAYSTEISSTDKLNIKKTGNWPVYFTAYQQYWNAKPEKVTGDFTVNSSFEKNDNAVTALKIGEPVLMKVKVDVRADADYVMIEIPIPAGCSYKDKNEQWFNNEVHREYFKNKVSIFCNSLRKGQYTFTVQLLPKYTGGYHLNPAKAEMMYFPVFYGREGMKKIIIN